LKAFEKKIRSVRLRCSVNILLRQAGRVAAVAGVIAVLAALLRQLLAVDVITGAGVAIFLGCAAAAVLLLWLLQQPSRMQASLLLDERLRLRERISTAVALADSPEPFARAACAEAKQRAEELAVSGHFPIRPSRCWIYAASAWALALAIVFLVPPKDLFGFLKKQQQQQQRARQLAEARAEIKRAAEPVELVVKRLGDPNLAEALQKLMNVPEGAKPQDIRREAIRTLGDISEGIKRMRDSSDLTAAKLLQRMFKRLPGSSQMFSQKLRQALARGDFGQASKQLEQLRRQLENSDLTDAQKKSLAGQLQELAAQIEKLARMNSELRKELEKLGLDGQLARADSQQLRQALEKQGLSPEQIEDLLKKAAACRLAASQCSSLGQAMSACGTGSSGLTPEQLGQVMDKLDELAATQEQLALMEASLGELSRCMGRLGEGMCEGLGQMGPFTEGTARKAGPGTGGPGIGHGPRETDQRGDTSTKQTKVAGQTRPGPMVASWYVKGTQVKGETKRQFSQVVRAARDGAAEAISENQIPRKYEDAVKNYFGRLEEAGLRE